MEMYQTRRRIGTLLISIAIYFLLMIVIEQIGLSRIFANALSAFYLILLIMFPAAHYGAIRSGKFFFADRNVTSATNVFAIAAVTLSPFILVGSGYYFFKTPGLLITFSVCICAALATTTLIAARPFRQSGATCLANFQINKFNSTYSARLSAFVNLFAGMLMFLAAIQFASDIASWFFGFSKDLMIVFLAIAIMFVAVFGGLSSISRQAAIAMIILLIALLLPLFLASFDQDRIPAGLLTFVSSAIAPFHEIETQLASSSIASLRDAVSYQSVVSSWGDLNWNISAFLMFVGMLSIPNLLQQFATARTRDQASRSGQNSILLVGFLFLTVFALLAFCKLFLYETFLGLSAQEVRQEAQFLFNGPNGFVSICDQIVSSTNQVIAACGGDPSHQIAMDELNFNGNLLLASSALMMGYPYVFTGFIVVALISTFIAFCGATLLEVSTNLISAYLTSQERQLPSIEMFLCRFTLILLLLIAVVLVWQVKLDPTVLCIFAFSIYAASLTPSVIAMFVWTKVSNIAVFYSVGVGFILTLVLFLLMSVGIDFKPGTGDEIEIALISTENISPILAGFLVLPISLALLIGISFWKPNQPLVEQSDVEPIFDDAIYSDNERVTILRNRL